MDNDSGPFGLMFHHFVDGKKHPFAQGALSLQEFEKLVEGLVNIYKVLPAGEWAKKALNNELENGEVCITFDDGLKCQADVALPVLNDRGLTAFWFVPSGILVGEAGVLEVFRRFSNEFFPEITDFYNSFFNITFGPEYEQETRKIARDIPSEYLKEFPFYTKEDRLFRYVRDVVLRSDKYTERMMALIRSKEVDLDKLSEDLYLDKSLIKKLENEGHIFGLHSHSHPTLLAELSEKNQRTEYEKNYEILNEILTVPPFTMAHPCNSYNDETLKILRDLGIRIGFCSNMIMKNYSSLEFPREDSTNLLNDLNLV